MFESFGRRVSTSIAIARNVLTSEIASAPASSAARANDATSVTFGVSFGITGSRRHLRIALTTSKVPVRLQPNWMPPSLMFGHEMLTSIAPTPSCVRQHARDLAVLVDRRPADVDDRRRAQAAELRQPLGDEPVDPDALEPDRVQHSGGRFDDALRRMPFARREEQPLHGDAAERGDVHRVAVLEPVPEAARGRDDRVLAAGAIRFERRGRPCRQCPVAESLTQSSVLASKTGPSMQQRT